MPEKTKLLRCRWELNKGQAALQLKKAEAVHAALQGIRQQLQPIIQQQKTAAEQRKQEEEQQQVHKRVVLDGQRDVKESVHAEACCQSVKLPACRLVLVQ